MGCTRSLLFPQCHGKQTRQPFISFPGSKTIHFSCRRKRLRSSGLVFLTQWVTLLIPDTEKGWGRSDEASSIGSNVVCASVHPVDADSGIRLTHLHQRLPAHGIGTTEIDQPEDNKR